MKKITSFAVPNIPACQDFDPVTKIATAYDPVEHMFLKRKFKCWQVVIFDGADFPVGCEVVETVRREDGTGFTVGLFSEWEAVEEEKPNALVAS